MKLKSIRKLTGTIILETGLHIGAGDIEMHIGGTDNPVVKHPFTHEPYIPGSSIKGKVRSLLELKSGLVVKSNGKPLSMEVAKGDKFGEKIVKLFGTSGADTKAKETLGPTRVSFADCFLTEEYKEKAQQGEIVLTEVKAENSINRITGTAENPRFTERVPAGVKFSFCITLKEFEGDEGLLDLLLQGLKLLEYDALGGSGSRGYGRIRFEFDDDDLNNQFKQIDPFKN